MRTVLKKGTMIRVPGGILYKIAGGPIGEGGGSIIYPVRKYLPDGNDSYRESPILYAVKECYPLSIKYEFCRNDRGEVVPEGESEAAGVYLARIKQMQFSENAVSGEIYHTGFRLTPVLESFQEIEISQDEGLSFHRVCNSISVMESIAEKGISLKNCLKEKKHLSADETFRIIEQVLYAVREVHDAGYLHLDIQDGNIFLKGTFQDASGMISLIDFGSARKRKEDGKCEAVEDGILYSTPGFSAPEMSSGNDGTLRLGPQADIYSIGYLMLLLLTGRRFSAKELGANKTGRYIPRFSVRKTKCPKHLVERMQEILAKALAGKPENRYADTREMLEDVTEFLAMLAPYKSPLSAVDYDAFICYKHGPLDSPVAKTLQNALERYKGGKLFRQKPIRRVFLDEGELSSCADFGERIREALKNSAWLIVICSGDTKESPWVNDEIETFLEYHDMSHVLTVVTEGEPKEVFPEALLKHGMDGNHLLAADARAENTKQVLKKIRGDVKLKIAAPILNTTFDTLKQRMKLYEIKRAFAAACMGFLILSAFFGYAALKSKQIADQAVRIAEEHKAALKGEALRLLDQAKQSYEANDPIAAVDQALRAYELTEPDGVILPGLIQILAEAMGIYTLPLGADEAVTAQGIFELGDRGFQDEFFLDSEGKYLFTADIRNMYIWDTNTFKCIKTIPSSWSIELFDECFLMEQQNRYFFMTGLDINCYDYENDISVWKYEFDDVVRTAALSDDKTWLAAATDQNLYIFDAADGTLLQMSELPNAGEFRLAESFPVISPDKKRIVFVRDKEEGDSVYLIEIVLYQVESDEYFVLSSFKNNNSASHTDKLIHFTDQNQLFMGYGIGTNTVMWSSKIYKFYSVKQSLHVSLYDPEKKCTVWESQKDFMALRGQIMVYDTLYSGKPAFVLVYGRNYEILDQLTGEILESYETEAYVVSTLSAENINVLVLENGDVVWHEQGTNRLSGYGWFPEGIAKCRKAGSGYYIREYKDFTSGCEDYVIKYQAGVFADGYETCAVLIDKENNIKNEFSKKLQLPAEDAEEDVENEQYHIYMQDNSIVIDNKMLHAKHVLETEEEPKGFFLMQEAGKLLIGYEDQVSLYDIETESVTDTFMFEYNNFWAVSVKMQKLDTSTVICIGSSYSYVIDVSEDLLEILYVLKDYYGYDEAEDAFYFLCSEYDINRVNERMVIDKQEIGKIKRYSKEEIIEMARQRYR